MAFFRTQVLVRKHMAVERVVSTKLRRLEPEVVVVLIAEPRLQEQQRVVPVAHARPSIRASLHAASPREPPQLKRSDVQVEGVLRIVILRTGNPFLASQLSVCLSRACLGKNDRFQDLNNGLSEKRPFVSLP